MRCMIMPRPLAPGRKSKPLALFLALSYLNKVIEMHVLLCRAHDLKNRMLGDDLTPHLTHPNVWIGAQETNVIKDF